MSTLILTALEASGSVETSVDNTTNVGATPNSNSEATNSNEIRTIAAGESATARGAAALHSPPPAVASTITASSTSPAVAPTVAPPHAVVATVAAPLDAVEEGLNSLAKIFELAPAKKDEILTGFRKTLSLEKEGAAIEEQINERLSTAVTDEQELALEAAKKAVASVVTNRCYTRIIKASVSMLLVRSGIPGEACVMDDKEKAYLTSLSKVPVEECTPQIWKRVEGVLDPEHYRQFRQQVNRCVNAMSAKADAVASAARGRAQLKTAKKSLHDILSSLEEDLDKVMECFWRGEWEEFLTGIQIEPDEMLGKKGKRSLPGADAGDSATKRRRQDSTGGGSSSSAGGSSSGVAPRVPVVTPRAGSSGARRGPREPELIDLIENDKKIHLSKYFSSKNITPFGPNCLEIQQGVSGEEGADLPLAGTRFRVVMRTGHRKVLKDGQKDVDSFEFLTGGIATEDGYQRPGGELLPLNKYKDKVGGSDASTGQWCYVQMPVQVPES